MIKVLNFVASAATLALAALPISALTTVAHAQTPVRIAVSDLDLSSPAGAAAFDRRVRRAADDLCGYNDAPAPRSPSCREAVRAEALEKLGEAQRRSLVTASAALSGRAGL